LLWLLHFNHKLECTVSRPLHPVERFAAHGLPAFVATHLSKQQCLLSTGNAMSVPVVGAVLARVLQAMNFLTEPHSFVPFQTQTDFDEQLNKIQKKRKLSYEIGKLEGEALVYHSAKRTLQPYIAQVRLRR
jgi:hypothetical protein